MGKRRSSNEVGGPTWAFSLPSFLPSHSFLCSYNLSTDVSFLISGSSWQCISALPYLVAITADINSAHASEIDCFFFLGNVAHHQVFNSQK